MPAVFVKSRLVIEPPSSGIVRPLITLAISSVITVGHHVAPALAWIYHALMRDQVDAADHPIAMQRP